MRLKIVSDGTRFGTRIEDQATGQEVEGVFEIEWRFSARDAAPEATVTLFAVPVEIDVETGDLKSEVLKAKKPE